MGGRFIWMKFSPRPHLIPVLKDSTYKEVVYFGAKLGQDFGESQFSFNLSDDPGESCEESSRSKVSHIELSSDEEYWIYVKY